MGKKVTSTGKATTTTTKKTTTTTKKDTTPKSTGIGQPSKTSAGTTKAQNKAAKAQAAGKNANVSYNANGSASVTVNSTNKNGKTVATTTTYRKDGTVKQTKKVVNNPKTGTTKTTTVNKNKAGAKTSVNTTTVKKNGNTTSVTKKYNEKTGKLTKKTTEKTDKKKGTTTKETVKYTQNKAGKTVRTSAKTVVKDKDGKVTSKKVVKYNKETGVRTSRRTETTTADGKKKVVTDKFNKKGKITNRTVKVGGKETSKTSWKYDKNSNLIRKTEKDLVGNKVTVKNYSNYKTNADGTVTRTVKVTVKDKDTGKITERNVEQTLNEKGKLTKSVYKDADGNVTRERNYTYDEKGKLSGETDVRTYSDGSTKTVTYTRTGSDGINTTFKRTITFKSKDGHTTKSYEDTATKGPDGKYTRVRNKANSGAAWIQGMLEGAGSMMKNIINYLKNFGNLSEEEAAELAKYETSGVGTGGTTPATGTTPAAGTTPGTTEAGTTPATSKLPSTSATTIEYPPTMKVSTETKTEVIEGKSKEVSVSVLENPGTEAAIVNIGGQAVSVPAGQSIIIHDDGSGIIRYEAKEGSTISITINQTDNDTKETKSASIVTPAGIMAHPVQANYPKYSGFAATLENPTDKEITVKVGDEEIKIPAHQRALIKINGSDGKVEHSLSNILTSD